MSSTTDWKEAKASCACGQLSVSLQIPASSFPLLQSFCHCDTCRYSTGQLAIAALLLPRDDKDRRAVSIQGVPTSRNSERFNRVFCGTCGTSVYGSAHGTTDQPFFLNSGAFKGPAEDYEFWRHICIEDTLDGGFSTWLPAPQLAGDASSDRSAFSSDIRPTGNLSEVEMSSDHLEGKCLCGGVHFRLTRPNEDLGKIFFPFMDAMKGEWGDEFAHSPIESQHWLSKDGKRYFAIVCPCQSCTKYSGSDFQTWTFVPTANIVSPDGSPYKFEHTDSSIKYFNSSEGVRRYFCGTCGATAFWASEEDHSMVDVSVGLLRSKFGARAEDWLSWATTSIAFTEEAQDPALAKRVLAGMKEWASRTHQEVLPVPVKG